MFESFNFLWFISIFETFIIFLIPAVIIKCSKKVNKPNEDGINTQPILNKSTTEIVKNDGTELSKSEKEGKELDLSNIHDSIRVAKINQQRNNPLLKEETIKSTKKIYTKSASEASKSGYESTCEASSVKFVSAESLTDEIIVPVGKTSRAPVPVSSMTSVDNLKTHGQSRTEVTVKFGDERISTKRTKPLIFFIIGYCKRITYKKKVRQLRKKITKNNYTEK
uniref:Uncharacterized protein n=1 Tax=Panagrolaimus sp. PS1159 TaxID=55785 RepID=A0AC35GN41_9BILA